MTHRSRIAWTDYSGGDVNFVIRGRDPGECECAPECDHCYARAILARNPKTRTQTTVYPEKLRRLCRDTFAPGATPFRRGPGSRPLVFVCDMGDLFHPSVPTDFIQQALSEMAHRHDVDWQILTKRPARMSAVIANWLGSVTPFPENLWLGTTAGTQAAAERNLSWLLGIRAKVRFLSVEPMLEPMTLCGLYFSRSVSYNALDGAGVDTSSVCQSIPNFLGFSLSWVIVGGESGRQRRPFDPEWARRLRDECIFAKVPFFYKQGSDLYPGRDDLLDGRTWKEFPL